MKTKYLVLDSLLASLLLAAQIALAGLPNLELVSLLLILYTLVLERRVWLLLTVFLLAEGFFYGFGIWWFSWLYAWPLLCLAVRRFRRWSHPFTWAAFSCAFGLSFGLLCSLPYLFAGGPGAALSWWIAGIPFDLIHGVSNFFLTAVLFKPLHRLLTRLDSRF